MKKGWKIFLITCAAVFGAGVVLCIAGFAVGVSDQEVRNAFDWGFGRFGRLGILHDHAVTEYEENTSMEVTGPIDGEGEMTFSGIYNLEIDVGGLKVEICTTEGDHIRVDAEDINSECEYGIYDEGDTLIVHSELKKHHAPEQGEVILYIPKDWKFNHAEISIGAGALEIEELNAGELDMEVGAGSISAERISVDRDTSLTCGMGAIELRMDGAKEDYNYDMEVGMGSVVIGGSEFDGMALEKTIQNSASKNMEIECGMGSVEIYF